MGWYYAGVVLPVVFLLFILRKALGWEFPLMLWHALRHVRPEHRNLKARSQATGR